MASSKIASRLRALSASYLALVLTTYSGALKNLFTGTPVGWASIHQITWIPIILYLLVFVLVWLLQGVGLLLQRKQAK